MSIYGRIRTATHLRRELLAEGWQFCATDPGNITTPEALLILPQDWLPTTVPNTVASALRQTQRWSLDSPPRNFDAEDWWFRLEFRAQPDQPLESTVLCIGGLATVADVWLNGEHLLHCENMFRSHRIDVGTRLRTENQLLIRFVALDTLIAIKRPRPRWKAPMIQHQQLRWLRTTLLGRTPGWSPPVAAVGPWREIWLERQKLVRIDSPPHMKTAVENGVGVIEIACNIKPLGEEIRIVSCQLSLTRGTVCATTLLESQNHHNFEGHLEIEKPSLWWPHTHGDPALYKVHLRILVELREQTHSIDLDLGSAGFRKVTLDTANGNFVIALNDVPVFCRGACWTPPDVVALDSNTELLERNIRLVREAGMNMLRISGTMVYENDEFLDFCDDNGILLWQDMMFANMDYPETEEFLAEVNAEITQVTERLGPHPCLTVLCGNSEGEQQAAMFGATRDRWNPPLFHQHIPTLLADLLPNIPYWPSSAHGGSFPYQNNVGTTSYYGVGAYLRPLEDARRSEVKFATECLAFANVPEDSCIEKMPGGLALRIHHPQWKARTPRDLGAGWDFEDVRDHYLKLLHGIDPLTLRYANHERYLELSRIITGEVMAYTFADWRRKRSTCRGALIWFLQDLIPGSGWGIIDANGNPKAAYYHLRRALQPLTVSISDEGCNGLTLHLINETSDLFRGILEISLYRNSEIIIGNSKQSIVVNPNDALEIPALAAFDGFSDMNYAYRFGPTSHDIVIATLTDVSGNKVSEAVYFQNRTTRVLESDIGLSAIAHPVPGTEKEMELRIITRRFAESVYVNVHGCRVQDNYFHLSPGSEHRARIFTPTILQTPLGTVRALNCTKSIPIEICLAYHR